MAYYLNWHRPAVLQLIEVYKNSPCMYDLKSPDYLNREKIRAGVEEMVLAVSSYHPEITPEDCKRKYHGLRNQFRKDYLKMRAALKTGEKYVPILWCYDELKFLTDFIYKATRGNCPKFSDEEVSEGNEDKEGEDNDEDGDSDNEKSADIFSTAITWKRPAVLRLIEVYKKSPCLYDTESPDYLKRQKIREAMDIMTLAVSEIQPDVTTEHCRRKYKCLRIQFRREFIKMAMAKFKFGAEYEPHFWCFQEMKFLEKYISLTHTHKGKAYDLSILNTSADKEDNKDKDLVFDDKEIEDNDKDLKAADNGKDIKAADNDKDIKAVDNDKDIKTTDNDKDIKAVDNDKDIKAADNDKATEVADNDKYKKAKVSDEDIQAFDNDLFNEAYDTDEDKEADKIDEDKDVEENNDKEDYDLNEDLCDSDVDDEINRLFSDNDKEDTDNEEDQPSQDIAIYRKRANSPYQSTSTVKRFRCDSSSSETSTSSTEETERQQSVWIAVAKIIKLIVKKQEQRDREREQDANYAFGRFVASCLRSMTPRNQRKATLEIMKLIMHHEEMEDKDE